MKRWMSLAAVILCIGIYFFLRHRHETKTHSFSSQWSVEKSHSQPLPSKKQPVYKTNLPVEIQAGKSGKRAVRIQPIAQNIENEILKRDDFLGRYRVPSQRDEPFDRLRLRAVDEKRFDPSMGAQVGKLLGYVIVESPTPDAPLLTRDTLPVVSSKGNGRLGVVTGTVIVTLHDPDQVSLVKSNHALRLLFEDKTARIAYFAAGTGTRLDELIEDLKRDEMVEHVRLEIVQGKKKFQ